MKFADLLKLFSLQMFSDGGDGGDGGTADSGVSTPDAGEARLRELGVPEEQLAKRAKRAGRSYTPPATKQTTAQDKPAQQAAAATQSAPEGDTDAVPKRLSWDEIMADPEYNKQMQATIQARLKTSKAAEERLAKLSPAIEMLAPRYGLDANDLDADALTAAIKKEYYEDKALEMGVSAETAEMIDTNERNQAEEQATLEQQKFADHIKGLEQQAEELKTKFPGFDFITEMKNPKFARMTAPDMPFTVEDAYFAIHRNELQAAAMHVAAQKTAERVADNIRSGQSRPQENGISAQAPSNTSFDAANTSKERREYIRQRVREAAARGEKIYPGQI